MSQKTPPCKDCKNRRINCHSSCKMYMDFVKAVEKEREDRLDRLKKMDDYYIVTQKKLRKYKTNFMESGGFGGCKNE